MKLNISYYLCILIAVLVYETYGYTISTTATEDGDKTLGEKPHDCPCNSTTKEVSCQISPKALPETLKQLVENCISLLTLKLGIKESMDINTFEIDLTLLQNFTMLQNIWLSKVQPENSRGYQVNFQSYGKPLPITEFHFNLGLMRFSRPDLNITLDSDQALSGILTSLTSLSNLDLSGTMELQGESFITISPGLANRSLRVLKLNQFQNSGKSLSITRVDLNALLHHLNTTILQKLHLSNNGILNLYAGFSDKVPNLQRLDLSHNSIISVQDGMYFELLFHPTLRILDARGQGTILQPVIKSYLHEDEYETLGDEHQQVENWSHAHLNPNNMFPANSSLPGTKQHEEDVENFLTMIMRTLEHQQYPFSDQRYAACVRKFPTKVLLKNHSAECEFLSCLSNSFLNVTCSLIPNFIEALKYLDVKCVFDLKIPLGRNIQELYFDDLGIHTTDRYTEGDFAHLCLTSPSLQKLTMSYNSAWFNSYNVLPMLPKTDFGENNLSFIDLAHNNLILNENVSLLTLKKAEHVIYSGNTLTFSYGSICDRMPKIKTLKFDHSNISELPSDFFKSCHDIQNASLSYNSIRNISLFFSEKFVTNHSGQIHLNLSNNHISYFEHLFLQEIDKVKGLQIDLTGNPLECTCNDKSMEFIQWLKRNRLKFVNFDSYLCSGPRGLVTINSVSLPQLQKECQPLWEFVLIVVLSTALPIIMLFVLGTVSYQQRFRLKLFIKKLFYTGEKQHLDRIHDIYVIYSKEDRHWVHECLQRELGQKRGFKIYLDLLHTPNESKYLSNRRTSTSELQDSLTEADDEVQATSNRMTRQEYPEQAAALKTVHDSMINSRAFIFVYTEKYFEKNIWKQEISQARQQHDQFHCPVVILNLGGCPHDFPPLDTDHECVQALLRACDVIDWPDDGDIHRHPKMPQNTQPDDTALLISPDQVMKRTDKRQEAIYEFNRKTNKLWDQVESRLMEVYSKTKCC